MKLWIDDVRLAPKGYIWCRSVNDTIELIKKIEHRNAFYTIHTSEGITEDKEIELIDIDHEED